MPFQNDKILVCLTTRRPNRASNPQGLSLLADFEVKGYMFEQYETERETPSLTEDPKGIFENYEIKSWVFSRACTRSWQVRP